jgi:cell wall-associated NlpC family hydrolase
MNLWLAQMAVQAGWHRILLRTLVLFLFVVLLIAVSLCGTLSAGLQSSTLAWPVPIPEAGKEADGWQAGGWEISSRFGWREHPMEPGTLEFHDGIDLAGKPFDLYQPTVAVFDAQVAYVGWDDPTAERPDEIGGGQMVILNNGDGQMEVLYAHLQPYRLYIQLQGRLDGSNQYVPVGTAELQPEPLDASIDTTCTGDGATFVPTRLSAGTYLLLYDRPAACTTTVSWPAASGWYPDGLTSLIWTTPIEEGMLAKDVALRFRGRLVPNAQAQREDTTRHERMQVETPVAATVRHPRNGSVVPRAANAPPRDPAMPGAQCERLDAQTTCRWSLHAIPDRVEQVVPSLPIHSGPVTQSRIKMDELEKLYPGMLIMLPYRGDGRPAGDVIVPPVPLQDEPPQPRQRRMPADGPPLQPISFQQGMNLVAETRAQGVLQAADTGDIDTSAPCYRAAQAALTKQGAIYSQGGHLRGDPIDPATGTFYPRAGPNSFDCSGLTWWAYQQAGITIGGVVSTQALDGVHIPCTLADLRGPDTTCWAPGDLIMLAMPGIGPSHVAIYVGSGLFMDCYNHAVNCVLHEVQDDWAYRTYFWQARRYANGCADHVLDIPPPSAGWGGDASIVRQPEFQPGGPCVHGIPTFREDIETFPGCGPPVDLGTRLKMLDSRVGYIGLSGTTTGPHLHFGLTHVGLSGQPTTTDVCTDAWLHGRTPPPGHACTTRQADPLDFLPRAHATTPLASAKDAPAVDEPYQLPPPGTDGALLSSPAPEASLAGEYWAPNTEEGRFGGGSVWNWLWCWLVPFTDGCSR